MLNSRDTYLAVLNYFGYDLTAALYNTGQQLFYRHPLPYLVSKAIVNLQIDKEHTAIWFMSYSVSGINILFYCHRLFLVSPIDASM